MRQIPFVTETQAKIARQMEEKLLILPEEAGILFVSVSVQPHLNSGPRYAVWVGCERKLDLGTARVLVEHFLKDLIPSGATLKVYARKGVIKNKLTQD